MGQAAAKDPKISYTLMDRVTDLLICSRCFRRNVRKQITTHFSRRGRPMPICDECSGKIKPGHTAKVVTMSSI